MKEKVRSLVLQAVACESFQGWVFEANDELWFYRISSRPELWLAIYTAWRAVAPIVTVLVVMKFAEWVNRHWGI